MPQLTNLVLTDRAATPVARTFTPRSLEGGVGILVNNSGVPIGESRFGISVRRTTNGRYIVRETLTVPVLVTETINGVANPKVARTAYVTCEFSFDGASTEQERKDVVGMFQSSLDAAKWTNDTLTKLESVY